MSEWQPWGSPRLHILLVDDNPGDCLLVDEAVARQDTQVEITTRSDGSSALNWLIEQSGQEGLPDVLLLDVRMPGLNGLDLLRAVRQHPELHHLPAVMLTTSDDADDVRRAYDLISSGYLVKEHGFEAFTAQVHTFISYWSRVKFARQKYHRPA